MNTDDRGFLKLKGLDAGEYYLEELKAPDGYNSLKNPIKITITPEKNNTQNYLNSTDSKEEIYASNSDVLKNIHTDVYAGRKLDHTYEANTTIAGVPVSNDGTIVLKESGNGDAEKDIVQVYIRNRSGSVLPSTGGSGTGRYYLIGGFMIIAAVFILLRKRRTA